MEGRYIGDEGRDLVIWICLVLDYVVIYLFGFVIFWFWIWLFGFLMIWIWLCGYLFVFWICIFFNKYFGFLYLDLLILYQKAKGSKIINFFFFLKY
jgi:hypothetical protein